MAPQITSWEYLTMLSEEFDTKTGEFRYTMFAVVDDDVVYFGQLSMPQHEITFQQLTSTLGPIPDKDIFPEWPSSSVELTRAPEALPPKVYIKRPNLSMYDVFKEHNVLPLLSQGLLQEAQAMQVLSQHPHPNIITYHGCRVRQARISGLVLDRHPKNLIDYVKHGIGTVDKGPFMEAFESAINHLHSLGWAHNDLNPGTILVNEAGMPVLIDFGSSHEIGKKLTTSRGTKGWIDEDMKDYTTSERRHDISALDKIRSWLDKPTFED
ncbi:kinase-like domain-containing protein [Lineolata rhizophorae]|uniref:Kinase-like domain-containing protein n=1 Tax=Lineolata rhizophorae TaxID=578093 RepID=A0A6A6NM32_9PEZI|nr:kinase-like domain-containing protein [Lineolata rhizophorae]